MICTGQIDSIAMWHGTWYTLGPMFISKDLTLWENTNFLTNSPTACPQLHRNQTPQEKENKCVQNKQNQIAKKQMLISIAFA